ncbi:type II toxin-antitoxin system PemK/MazF family toxin [Alkalicoccobacillus gibsonii]|uniref:type II toxin-antitoxin system PemK/MazF family toxin n=1 Tax=Alkalicoccobacillus gibsonii TaxID=79881 RepID=UPI001931DEC8|nr:type II toxin-antitoxin system PemK/MazF family toxin [Alkalicoccobacillus gibsonii]MBM0064795.1 type II toxin-antitoxin system PemK/MazF family toxin [Alkalicoccobacillus gibsonii]
MSKIDFKQRKNWHIIERGCFYQAAMPYMSDTEQPLKFLTSDESGKLSFVERTDDFLPAEDENGRKTAVPQDIIVTVKPRQVVVLSNDVLNKSRDYSYVQVAPVYGLYKTDTTRWYYEDLINDKLEGSVYVPSNGYGIRIDLIQITSIHKSMLLQKQRKVDKERMELIESELVGLLDL